MSRTRNSSLARHADPSSDRKADRLVRFGNRFFIFALGGAVTAAAFWALGMLDKREIIEYSKPEVAQQPPGPRQPGQRKPTDPRQAALGKDPRQSQPDPMAELRKIQDINERNRQRMQGRMRNPQPGQPPRPYAPQPPGVPRPQPPGAPRPR